MVEKIFNLFSSTYDNNHKYTQKKNMEMIYEFIIGAYLPNFEHIETGRSLDSKM